MRLNYTGLLMIAYKYPPVKAIGSLRNYNVSLAFSSFFDSVQVVTTANRRVLPRQELPEKNDVAIHVARTLDTKTIWQWVNGHKRASSVSVKSWKSAWMQVVYRIRDSFPMNLFLNEGGFVYIAHAFILGARLIRQGGISHVYSSFRPFADHVVAYLLKRRFPELTWIADFRDLPVDPNKQNVIWPAFQDWIYRRMLRHASVAVTVSKGYGEYLKRYGCPVVVLRNGIGSWLKDGPAPAAENKAFAITYTGSIYPEYQHAALALEALGELMEEGKIDRKRVRLRYLGNDPAIWQDWMKQYALEDIQENHGPQPLEFALNAQRDSCINLLLSWSGPVVSGVLTGKLYEYLHARRPILAMVQGTADRELEEILSSTWAGAVAYHRPEYKEPVKAFIWREYQNWTIGLETEFRLNEEALKAYTWADQTRQFFRHLEAIGPVYRPRLKISPVVAPLKAALPDR